MRFTLAAHRTGSVCSAQSLFDRSKDCGPVLLADLSYGSSQPHQILADFKTQGFDFYAQREFELARVEALKTSPFGRLDVANIRAFIGDECRGNPFVRAIEASAQRILACLRDGAVSNIFFVPPFGGIELDLENKWLLWFLFSRATSIERESFGFIVGATEDWTYPEFVVPRYSSFIQGVSTIEPSHDASSERELYRLLAPPGFVQTTPEIQRFVVPLGTSGLAWIPPCIRELCSLLTTTEVYSLQAKVTGESFLRQNSRVMSLPDSYLEAAVVQQVQQWTSNGGIDGAIRLLIWAISISKGAQCAQRLALYVLWLLLVDGRYAHLADPRAIEHSQFPVSLEGEFLFIEGWGEALSDSAHTATQGLEEALCLLQTDEAQSKLPYLQRALAQASLRLGKLKHQVLLQKAVTENTCAESEVKGQTLNFLNQINLASLSTFTGNLRKTILHIDPAVPESRHFLFNDEAMFRRACTARKLDKVENPDEARSHWLSAALHFVANPVPETISAHYIQIFLPNYRGSRVGAINWVAVWLIHKLDIGHLCDGTEAEAAVFMSDCSDQAMVSVQSSEAWILADRAVLASGQFTSSSLNMYSEHLRLRRGLTNLLCQAVQSLTLPRTFIVPTHLGMAHSPFDQMRNLVLARYRPAHIRTSGGTRHGPCDERTKVDELEIVVSKRLNGLDLQDMTVDSLAAKGEHQLAK